MRLTWKQKDFDEDIDFILFHQKDGTPKYWHYHLFHAYPDLDYNYCWSAGISEEQRFDYIVKQMKIQAKKRQDIVNKSVKSFQQFWNNNITDKLNKVFSSAFDNDCSNILNEMKAEVGLNPNCPRYIDKCSFDVYHYYDTQWAMTTALHEITHFVWFYFWQQHFKDNLDEYEFPNLKWLLSEIVVETIIRNSEIGNLIEFPQWIAYPYFYDMKINGKLLFDTMKKLYLERKNIYDFMEKAYNFIQQNEPELRKKIDEAESKTY